MKCLGGNPVCLSACIEERCLYLHTHPFTHLCICKMCCWEHSSRTPAPLQWHTPKTGTQTPLRHALLLRFKLGAGGEAYFRSELFLQRCKGERGDSGIISRETP